MLSGQPFHLSEADTMLTGAGAFHVQGAVHKSLVEYSCLGEVLLAVWSNKDYAMKIAVTNVPEKGHRHRGAVDVLGGFYDALGKTRDRYANVG